MGSSSTTRSRSIAPLVFTVALIASIAVAACGRGQDGPAAECAVYAEYSLSNKPMVAGWDARVFNKKEVQEGENISLDERTGVVTLKAGLHHITAMSLVNAYDTANPTIIPTSLTNTSGCVPAGQAVLSALPANILERALRRAQTRPAVSDRASYPVKVTTFPANNCPPGCGGRGPQDRSALAQQFTELDHTSLPPASN